MKTLEFRFLQVKKNIFRPILTLYQQLVIATHSFSLSPLRKKKARKSLEVKDKDPAMEEVRTEKVLEMHCVAVN